MKQMLKPCPFCGGEARIKDTKAYLDDAVVAYCTRCGTRQTYILVDHPRIIMSGPAGETQLDESTRYTREQAVEVAEKKWNRRATPTARRDEIDDRDDFILNPIGFRTFRLQKYVPRIDLLRMAACLEGNPLLPVVIRVNCQVDGGEMECEDDGK